MNVLARLASDGENQMSRSHLFVVPQSAADEPLDDRNAMRQHERVERRSCEERLLGVVKDLRDLPAAEGYLAGRPVHGKNHVRQEVQNDSL